MEINMIRNIKRLVPISMTIFTVLCVVVLMLDSVTRLSEYSYKDLKTDSFTFSLKKQKGLCFLRGCYIIYKCAAYYDTCPSGDSEFVLKNMPKITNIAYEDNTLKVYLARKCNLSGKFYISELNNNKPVIIINDKFVYHDYGYVEFIKAKLNIVFPNINNTGRFRILGD